MAAILGNARKCYIGTSLTAGWTWLTGEQTNSFNRSGNLVEVSDKSTVWQQFIAGVRGATAAVTVHADDSDAQQTALINALAAGTKVFVFIGEVTGTSSISLSKGDAFEAYVGAVNDTNDNGAVSTRQIELTVNGAPVHYPAEVSNG